MPRHQPAPLFPTADFGHAFVRRSARIVATRIGAADGMELADVADIDKPDKRGATVRVARRIDPLIAILDLKHSEPDRAKFLAADQFRRYTAIADGIRPMSWATFVATGMDGQTPAQLLLDAQRRVRSAWIAIRGPENNSLVANFVRLIVLGYVTLQIVETTHKMRHGSGRPVLDVGLDRLTDHYGTA